MGCFFQMFIKILSTILIFNLQCLIVLKTNAQIDENKVYHLCSGANITSIAYQSNLNLVLSSLINSFNKAIIRNGYYYDEIGQKPITAYGSYQCRGDLTPEECGYSVGIAAKEILRRCPNSEEAFITYKELAILKYSNQSFFSILRDKPSFTLPNAKSVTNPDEFNPPFDKLMNNLLAKVASNGVSSSSSSSVNKNLFAILNIDVTQSQKIYALAQCSSDLSIENCTQCLTGHMDDIRKRFRERDGGRVLSWSCYFRYETFPFYLLNATSPPFSSPMNLPPPQNGTPFNPLAMILIAIFSSVITVISIIIISYFCIKRRKTVLARKTEHINGIQSAESLQFKFSTISAATHNFSDANKLGRGGFGNVYK
ncbi:hypothetical protein MKW94_008297, partial [Papaver nudicaule]|nr:hypothetical protein [Papaver nudicaule]